MTIGAESEDSWSELLAPAQKRVEAPAAGLGKQVAEAMACHFVAATQFY